MVSLFTVHAKPDSLWWWWK